jgi:hypothetical protein
MPINRVEKTALFIALAGMLVLCCFMLLSTPEKIDARTNISLMQENTPVLFSGMVTEVSSSGSDYCVSIDNGLSFFSDSLIKQGENITVNGMTELYYDKMRIRALSIRK